MKLSTGLMARGRLGSKETLIALARAADEACLDKVWFGDHVVYPVDYEPNYPANNGRLTYNPASPQLDVIVAMTVVASVTSRVGIGTSVMVIGERQLVWLAKQIASLDQIAEGRLTLGIGVGWCREEYESLGVPWARRGARTDEYVEALHVLWTEDTARFSGEFVSFPPLHCNPKPVQDRGPPIWVGGSGPAAIERTARYGKGWVGTGLDADLLAKTHAAIKERARELGRADADEIGMLAQGVWRPDRSDLVRLLRELRDAGVTEAVVPVQGKTPEAAREFVASISELLD